MKCTAGAGLLLAGLLTSACSSGLPSSAPSIVLSATSTSAATSTASQTAASRLPSGDIPPGRYFVDALGYRYTFTVGDTGWDSVGDSTNVLIRHDPGDAEHGILWLWGPLPQSDYLYRNPCHWSGTDFLPGPTVNDYAEALTSVDAWNATEPTDVTVGGRQGKRLQLTVPADANFDECEDGEFHLSAGRWYQAPGQTEDMRILDFDGSRYLVFTSWFTTTPTEIRAELDQMVDSMEIDKL
jgi:hypothetical protein